VLAKASIPLVVLPVLIFGIVVFSQLAMLLVSRIVLLGNAEGFAALWEHLKLFQSWLTLVYALIVIALWHAPLYAWLLLVSGWARRAAFLWAVLPLLAIAVVEKIAFNTAHFAALVQYRLIGWFNEAFSFHPVCNVPEEPLALLTPGRFLSTPGLWIGLVFAAGFLIAAARLRRYREPI